MLIYVFFSIFLRWYSSPSYLETGFKFSSVPPQIICITIRSPCPFQDLRRKCKSHIRLTNIDARKINRAILREWQTKIEINLLVVGWGSGWRRKQTKIWGQIYVQLLNQWILLCVNRNACRMICRIVNNFLFFLNQQSLRCYVKLFTGFLVTTFQWLSWHSYFLTCKVYPTSPRPLSATIT